jgi:hypothetical protein
VLEVVLVVDDLRYYYRDWVRVAVHFFVVEVALVEVVVLVELM